jgi:NAD+ diphosphatase
VKPLRLTHAEVALDRSSEVRKQPDELEALWKTGKIIHLARQKFLVENNRPKFLSEKEISNLSNNFIPGLRIFLGILDGIGFFAFCTDLKSELIEKFDGASEELIGSEFESYKTLRETDGNFNEFELNISVHAQALSNWHHAHPRCAKCGDTTTAAHGGTIRICDSCGAEHFPRVDPAIIVLLRDKADRIILGRQKVWPERRYSCFAGFVEPGESFEQTVEREVLEEAGVGVSEIKYLGSQPWPFPASLMISFEAITDTPELVKPDGEEIEAIKVLSRKEFEEELKSGKLLLPPEISVARKMIEAWRKA